MTVQAHDYVLEQSHTLFFFLVSHLLTLFWWIHVLYLSVTTPVFGCNAAWASQSDWGTALTHQKSDASVSQSPMMNIKRYGNMVKTYVQYDVRLHFTYIDLDTREYGAVFRRHSLLDGRHQFVLMAAFRSRYQFVKVQLQILDTKPFQPLKGYKNINIESFAPLLTPACNSGGVPV